MRIKRILAIILIILLLLLVWYAIDVLLLAFAGILVAVFLRGIAGFVSRYTGLSGGWSLAVTVLLLLAVIGLGVWYLSPKISDQVDNMTESLPQAVNRLEERVRDYKWGQWLLEQAPAPAEIIPSRQDTLSRITGIFSTTFGALADAVIILFIGLYLAINPKLYLAGLKHLVPPDKRARAAEVIEEIGYALRWWLVGQLVSMVVVGVLTGLGLWLIGVPLALSLGILAGLLEFIPQIGPLISFIPAALLALLDSPATALYVVGLYFGVQATESYLVLPLVQKKVVSLPPAITIFSIVLMGVLVGGIGVLLATPLAVVILVTVRMLYVRDTLGDTGVPDGMEK